MAHSHNDYEQNNPIVTALEHGFTSLEVDIVYDNGKILVSHEVEEIENKPAFESQYLFPFLNQINPKESYILLVDIKNYSDELIVMLNSIFQRYSSYLRSRNDTSSSDKKVTIVLSGDNPRKLLIENTENEFLFLDGRVEDLEYPFSKRYTPLISMNFADVINWKGDRAPTEEELNKVAAVIDQVHAHGKLIRFWNTRDTTLMWQTLNDLGVDLIGVDDIERFYNAYSR